MFLNQNNITLNNKQQAGAVRDLELFKMLLQPHFLFNSLNNLYALSVKKSDQTSDAIAGLSGMLSKVVDVSRNEYITLSRETELIEDYLDLERIWLGDMGYLLDYKVRGEADGFMLPPLVLYTFVENCFKHGIRKCSGERWVTIRIDVKDDKLHFLARNSISCTTDEKNSSERSTHSGVGMAAARELLEKKCTNGFELTCGRRGNLYEVDLMIYRLQNLMPDQEVQIRPNNRSQMAV